MKRWEYMVAEVEYHYDQNLTYRCGVNETKTCESLDSLGDQGWEAVSWNGDYVLMKREKQS